MDKLYKQHFDAEGLYRQHLDVEDIATEISNLLISESGSPSKIPEKVITVLSALNRSGYGFVKKVKEKGTPEPSHVPVEYKHTPGHVLYREEGYFCCYEDQFVIRFDNVACIEGNPASDTMIVVYMKSGEIIDVTEVDRFMIEWNNFNYKISRETQAAARDAKMKVVEYKRKD